MALVFIVIGVWGWDEGTMGFVGFELALRQQSLFLWACPDIEQGGEKEAWGLKVVRGQTSKMKLDSSL